MQTMGKRVNALSESIDDRDGTGDSPSDKEEPPSIIRYGRESVNIWRGLSYAISDQRLGDFLRQVDDGDGRKCLVGHG